jgi:hypothetical protein
MLHKLTLLAIVANTTEDRADEPHQYVYICKVIAAAACSSIAFGIGHVHDYLAA